MPMGDATRAPKVVPVEKEDRENDDTENDKKEDDNTYQLIIRTNKEN